MRDRWPEIRQAIIIASGFVILALFLLLVAAMRTEMLTDPQQILIALWILAALSGVRALWYTLTPREERPTFQLKRAAYWERRRGLTGTPIIIHAVIASCSHPYVGLAFFVCMAMRGLAMVYPR